MLDKLLNPVPAGHRPMKLEIHRSQVQVSDRPVRLLALTLSVSNDMMRHRQPVEA